MQSGNETNPTPALFLYLQYNHMEREPGTEAIFSCYSPSTDLHRSKPKKTKPKHTVPSTAVGLIRPICFT